MKENIIKGDILIAEPYSVDTYFRRTVVYLVDHSTHDGSIGFILNRPTNLMINEVLANFPEFEAKLYFGGPVANDNVYYIHTAGHILDNSIEVQSGIYWGGDFVKLKFLIENKIILPHQIRFYLGYSGWSDNQLPSELEQKDWLVSNGDINYIFYKKPKDLWSLVLKNMGVNYEVIADIPDNNSLN